MVDVMSNASHWRATISRMAASIAASASRSGLRMSSPGPRRPFGGHCVHLVDDLAERSRRVLANLHRGRTGMRGMTEQLDRVPAEPLYRADDADLERLGFQDRTLLNVQFERGGVGRRLRGTTAGPAKAVKLRADRNTIDVFERQRLLEHELATPYAGPHHRMLEARSFLVGPNGDFDRRVRRLAGCRGGTRRAPDPGSGRCRDGSQTDCRSRRTQSCIPPPRPTR